jgi:hypothetical protein
MTCQRIDGEESRSHLTGRPGMRNRVMAFDCYSKGCVILVQRAMGSAAKGITYISGSRIFSALEVAGDVFSRADVGQQLVEPRRRAR